MKSDIRRCGSCGRYTLSQTCPACGSATVNPIPPRYSPDDRMGEYRRRSILQEYGENGKHRDV
ncbi:MAG: RNA-protein complex protein Nop10 [Candidatus Methanomethylophilaceae archaeon]|nr:RNA-protein complex protein Nop10 [Candidatus Methanomethylophilaceae archaeon]MBQ7978942.1 RNA-protein complex protein Nop10 [Candidatus Methanomethylophilaceae archaeon]MBQ9689544.1 RNA-protein complex protein Nop10 [Candidatus Methanomethylophilaceae archaeon]